MKNFNTVWEQLKQHRDRILTNKQSMRIAYDLVAKKEEAKAEELATIQKQLEATKFYIADGCAYCTMLEILAAD